MRWFHEYLASPVWVTETIRSFAIGLASACITLIISVPAAFGIARSPSRLSSAVFVLFLSPIVIPPIVTAVAEDMRRLRRESLHGGELVIERMQDQIAATLTPEQRERFQEMINSRRQKIRRFIQQQQRMQDRPERGGP